MNTPNNYKFSYDWLPASDTHGTFCCLCGGMHAVEQVFTFLINEKMFSIMRCTHDDLMFLSPQPGTAYTNALYNHSSYFTGEDDMYGLAVSEEKSRTVAGFRIKEINDRLAMTEESIAGKAMLEIGCAYGHTLLEARVQGAEITDGIEFSREAVAMCNKRGLSVFLGSANDPFPVTVGEKTYDIIATYSLLEHVDNPLTFLNQIAPLLAENGILVIRVPEMSKEGPWLSLIDHFWHFTKTSLVRLLNKANFEKIDIFPSGTFQGVQHPGSLSSITIIARKKTRE